MALPVPLGVCNLLLSGFCPANDLKDRSEKTNKRYCLRAIKMFRIPHRIPSMNEAGQNGIEAIPCDRRGCNAATFLDLCLEPLAKLITVSFSQIGGISIG